MSAAAGDSASAQVAAGGYHSCAIDEEHRVWCWGWNFFGQACAFSALIAMAACRASGVLRCAYACVCVCPCACAAAHVHRPFLTFGVALAARRLFQLSVQDGRAARRRAQRLVAGARCPCLLPAPGLVLPCRISTETGVAPSHIRAGSGLTAAALRTSTYLPAVSFLSSLPLAPRDYVHRKTRRQKWRSPSTARSRKRGSWCLTTSRG